MFLVPRKVRQKYHETLLDVTSFDLNVLVVVRVFFLKLESSSAFRNDYSNEKLACGTRVKSLVYLVFQWRHKIARQFVGKIICITALLTCIVLEEEMFNNRKNFEVSLKWHRAITNEKDVSPKCINLLTAFIM